MSWRAALPVMTAFGSVSIDAAATPLYRRPGSAPKDTTLLAGVPNAASVGKR